MPSATAPAKRAFRQSPADDIGTRMPRAERPARQGTCAAPQRFEGPALGAAVASVLDRDGVAGADAAGAARGRATGVMPRSAVRVTVIWLTSSPGAAMSMAEDHGSGARGTRRGPAAEDVQRR